MFGVFFFFVILASLLVLWRWRADDCMLPWKKVVAACGICSVILFPLGLVFRADGLCFGTWEGAASSIVQYGIFFNGFMPVRTGVEWRGMVWRAP